MKTRDRLKFQKQLIKDLMQWEFTEQGYKMDLKELRIYNHQFTYPFYAATSRGPFFTFRPSFMVESQDLIKEVNSITRYQILFNCKFSFGERLNRYLSVENIRGYIEEENIYNLIAHNYSVRIYQLEQYDWALEWFKHYIEEVCFLLAKQIESEQLLYQFLRKVFNEQVLRPKNEDIRDSLNSYEFSIGHNEIITMIYLGYKYKMDNIGQLARMAAGYKEGPLYHEPIIDLIKYFED